MKRWLIGEEYAGMTDDEIARIQAIYAVEALLKRLLPPNIPFARGDVGIVLDSLKDFFSGSSLAESSVSVTHESTKN